LDNCAHEMLLSNGKVWVWLAGEEVNPMGSKREHMRVNCNSPCILNYDGINYQVLLDNISLSGALIKTGSEPPVSLYIGATVT
jgi:hypothetical protein